MERMDVEELSHLMEDESAEAPAGGTEYEVEHILKYRKHTDGQEYFLVKWVGFSVEEATWEPLAHMNDNCKELIVKARALFAWRKPSALKAAAPAASPDVSPPEALADEPELAGDDVDMAGILGDPEPEGDQSPLLAGGVDDEAAAEREASSSQAILRPRVQPTIEDGGILVDDGDDDEEEEEDDGVDELGFEEAAAPEPPQPPAGPPPAKRPKLQAGPGAGGSLSSKNGAVRGAPLPKASPPMDEDPDPAPVVAKKPVAREMKCICGASEKVSANNREKLVVCRICNCGLHPKCVEGSLRSLGKGAVVPDDYVCPPCRLERVDEFHPPVGSGLLRHSYAAHASTFTLSFTAQPSTWKKQQWAVHLRSVALSSADLCGPAWPHRVQGKLNGRQCVAIDPPKHLHVRREQCYNLTPLLKPGVNQLEVKFNPKPDASKSEIEESYSVGVVLTRPRSVASIIARIRTRSTETVNSGQQRVARLIAQTTKKEKNEEECKVTGNFGRMLKPLCPVSLCPIEESAIGRHCNHIQVFDLQTYIAVNQRMRSLDKRWTCPVCSAPLRPDDVVLDPFAQGILDTLRGDEDLVEAVVFNENCTWSTISAVKEGDRDSGAGGEEGGGAAESVQIDLSDSE